MYIRVGLQLIILHMHILCVYTIVYPVQHQKLVLFAALKKIRTRYTNIWS